MQDNTTKCKKIIFDDIDEQQCLKSEKTKKDLFDSDNEEDSVWNEDEFSIKENKRKKVSVYILVTLYIISFKLKIY